eukprot:m.480277 g.480277  ORF g.480277 m.480277 type:complete len:774 (-) comp21764_c0_seq1:325-2646(-)
MLVGRVMAAAAARSVQVTGVLPAGACGSVVNRRWYAAKPQIVYTYTDEAPALATHALLPIIRRFTEPANIEVVLSDISVASRILSTFPEVLPEDKKELGKDHLAELGQMCQSQSDANIIKLPNVSASIPQLNAAIAELQSHGYDVPNFPQEPSTPEEQDIKSRYEKVLGSAVNPVLREGNSDRRVAAPVKQYAQKNPHRLGAWTPETKTHVAHMTHGDFFETEQSHTTSAATAVQIQFTSSASGETKTLKPLFDLEAGEVIDASVMNVTVLREFFAKEIDDAKSSGLLFSLHLKATMMKISDPIMFGHCVTVFFDEVFSKHAETLSAAGVNPSNGFGDLYDKMDRIPADQRAAIEADIEACYAKRPDLAMVDSGRGITNLHVPSDVIIDASMPVVVRDSGKMWNKDDALQEAKCVIPDRCYATMYQEVFDFCREHGQFDVATMGNVPNVGLMARKAEEYGSHDKTFEVSEPGTMQVVDKDGKVVFEHAVNTGDIWRMCQTKDNAIKDWVRLAVSRARATGSPAIFWLDENRAHDRSIIAKVDQYLPEHDTAGLELSVMAPAAAARASMTRAKDGKDTISVTGNVLRDYLTDLFPIIELGTSAKMLSIVPLLAGGSLFETGAGGSAPKHVQQFQKEGHLRWDSLGEYLALACSLEELGVKHNNERAKLLGQTLTDAVGTWLDERKAPSRKVNEIDNRGSGYYIALYWAQNVAKEDPAFQQLADDLAANEAQITQDLIDCQGSPVDCGGYYQPDAAKTDAAMRASPTLNALIDQA